MPTPSGSRPYLILSSMKYLLLICSLLLAGLVHGQAVSTTVATPYRYCALVVDDRHFSSPGRVYLDYGQSAPNAVGDAEMAEMAKNIQQSKLVIDILNYLGRHGWEWLTTTTVQTRGHKSSINDLESDIDNETRYFFRRRTP